MNSLCITDMRRQDDLLIMERMGNIMFNFRIINLANGDQVIDPSLKTPYDSLTPLQMVEYTEMDEKIAYMNKMERNMHRDSEDKRKLARNPFRRLACVIGL